MLKHADSVSEVLKGKQPSSPRSRWWVAALVAVLHAGAAPAGDTERFVDERTGVKGWEFEEEGIRIRLIQRLPDQTRAFFLGRGFGKEAVDHLAGKCVFQTIIRNTYPEGGPAVALELGEWRALTAQGPEPLILKHQWQQDWKRRGVSESARIAFQWALFPTSQEFRPGDWNMGMTTYPVPPGTQIDVQAVWHTDGEKRTGRITGPECATNALAENLERSKQSD